MRFITYHGPISIFRRVVLPALWHIVEHPARIQAMVESALQRDPEYVRNLAEAR